MVNVIILRFVTKMSNNILILFRSMATPTALQLTKKMIVFLNYVSHNPSHTSLEMGYVQPLDTSSVKGTF